MGSHGAKAAAGSFGSGAVGNIYFGPATLVEEKEERLLMEGDRVLATEKVLEGMTASVVVAGEGAAMASVIVVDEAVLAA